MIQHTRWNLCLLAGILLISPPVWAQVPHLIRYQGQAVNKQGIPLDDGAYTLTFRFYDAPTDGKELWKEIQPQVPLTNGHFSVLLGSVTPMATMEWNTPCWLSVQVNGDKELAPRQQVTSVPMALRAEGLGDMSVRVYNANGISTADDAETLLTFDSETWDPNDMHATSGDKTSRLTAPVDGKYFIYGNVGFDATGVGYEEIDLKLNGGGLLASQSFTDTTNTYQTRLYVATYARLAKGDYVELVVFHHVGGSLNVFRQGGISPEFGMTKVE